MAASSSVAVAMPATVERAKRDSAERKEWSSMSLLEKMNDHYLHGSDKGTRSKNPVRFLFLFQATTQIYVTVTILMPHLFEDFDPLVLYCLQVWACHLCLMSVANWICIICYSRGNAYRPTRDRPHVPHYVSMQEQPPERFQGRLMPDAADHQHPAARGGHGTNGHVTVDITEKGGLPWKYCKRCDMSVPPRAHHCKFCRTCILRRDHHCHMVGCCIGHWNQRYFVILAGYGMVVGYVGAFLTITYLRYHHPPHLDFWSYVFPVTFYQWVKGHIGGLQILLTFHAYMLCLFGPVSNLYFLSQLNIIAQGKTMYEVSKKKNIKVTSSIEDNVRLVFGDYWLLNFLLPAQILFKQPSDGTHYDGVKVHHEEVKVHHEEVRGHNDGHYETSRKGSAKRAVD